MRAVLRWARSVVVLLLAAVVAVNLALLFSRFALKQDPAHVFGFYPMLLTTGSMEPDLPAGAMVVARAQADYAVGDIVSFRQEGAVVTHRIIGETAQGYQTAGDANNAPDQGTVPPEAVLGRVVLCLPRVGALLLLLRQPIGILALAAGGAVLFLLPEKRGEEPYDDAKKT